MALALVGSMAVMMSGMCAADVMIYASTVAPTFPAIERPVTLLNGDTGTSVHGSITNPSAGVLFSTTNDILFNTVLDARPAVEAQDGSINNLTITLPGFKFTDAILDIYGVYAVHPALTITVYLNDGAVAQTFQLQPGQISRNWITVEAFNHETIDKIVISDAKFYALEDVHISGAENGVPEPATLALVFSGLIGAGSKLRKYNRKAFNRESGVSK